MSISNWCCRRLCRRHVLPWAPARHTFAASKLVYNSNDNSNRNISYATGRSLTYPEPVNQSHHNLATYLAHAERIGLDVNSTTHVGTHYEYTVAAALRQYGFDLRRIGGPSDYGIDLLGTWTVPSAEEAFRVFLQCKASAQNTKIGPHHIRELEGAFVGAPPGWRGAGVLGLLVTQKPATKGIRDALGRSKWPMAFISCSRDGLVQQMLWNSRAEDEGLGGLGVSVRHSQGEPNTEQLILTWKGKPAPLSLPATSVSASTESS